VVVIMLGDKEYMVDEPHRRIQPRMERRFREGGRIQGLQLSDQLRSFRAK
jgi:hypothetical protein